VDAVAGRLWSVDEKRRIVAETFVPGARRHDLNSNQRRDRVDKIEPLIWRQ
jgi:transposase-like protein